MLSNQTTSPLLARKVSPKANYDSGKWLAAGRQENLVKKKGKGISKGQNPKTGSGSKQKKNGQKKVCEAGKLRLGWHNTQSRRAMEEMD